MILFDQVNKCFMQKNEHKKIVAIDNCSFHIPKGIVTGIIGKSGSGKTTLLKLMCGLLQADQGRIRICNREPVVDRKSLSSLISVLFADKTALNEEETVAANFDFIPIIYKCNRTEFLDKKKKLIQLFELTNLLEEKIRHLSLGQKRRVECAYTLMCPAEVIILDEPCTGMDASAKQKFEQVIKDLAQLGKTVVISSHTMGELDRLCDRVILLDKGKLIFYGGLNEIYHQFMPIDVMTVNYDGKIPDMQDIPLVKYQMDQTKLMLYYNTNIISSAEIVKVLMETTKIAEVSIEKPHLEEVILALR